MLRKHLLPLVAAPIFSLGLVSGCANNGAYTDSALALGAGVLQATTLSEEQVKSVSQQAADKMDKENKVAPSSSKYAKRLEAITRNLKNADGLTLNYKVYLSDQINAFAMADGTVRVYSGLMDVMPDDQVLAVMQHEIGHVKLKHSYKQMREKLLTDAAFQAVVSAGGTVGELTQSQLGQIAYAAVNARFSQSDELEADAYAVKSLHRLGKDPYAMKRSIETLQKKVGGESSFLSSHPSNEKRLEKIQEEISRL
ncbi:putative Zn-dependent protease, contains TPR repeats [Hahella chejuensis KCTC 2396]|uniref:Putative Zn-dependent protease, contains TPR repeats n=1 Tax=Hahella chejuensis (strain KCTC 2396) TaxID=349521 RepID=Q2S777_HAHCH|nr:M48 family metallopeptidase [Hahella chejuensis]ABC33497.1 putative Zn-dependent protease, contains TPR repeats [Hahella chejuensis KCTC 2396]